MSKVYLRDVLPVDLLAKHLEDGIIRKQVHPEYPELYILNYTERAQFDRIWDACTNVCRGLIVCQGSPWFLSTPDWIVARGFNKFHNLNTEYMPQTMEANLPAETPLVTTKLDGSMGVFYAYPDRLWIATRGSFASEQAQWATEWFRQRFRNEDGAEGYCDEHWGVTPVFEIIYPENRIVVDYDFSGLVVLGLVDNATGLERPRAEAEDYAEVNNFQIVKRFDKSLAECAAEDRPNEEGYVLTYPSTGLKVKVKFAEYVRLHRILTGLNPKAIWELLAVSDQSPVYSILADPKMPEGFIQWFKGWVDQLQARYKELEETAKTAWNQRPQGGVRKDQALHFLKTPGISSVLFAMLDGKNYAPIIWAKIKPRGDDTFKKDGE